MNYTKIAIACDHAGYEYKESIKEYLSKKYALKLEDFGAYSKESVDYPDVAHKLALSVSTGETEIGIILCGSGNGVCMTVNKDKSIRGALCWNTEIVKLSRQHNNANVLCLPARFVSLEDALEMVEIFLATEFEGGRHLIRINKI